ncbi:MTH1187 family thiamine-binding protein [Deferribacteraceae bacterium V6Fe1]|uniref:MTH1187 family thiamine-binding protein n=1 Tax=Deferrivibrio essentukiensis TaxID=2880922 RepID=UPI001F608B3C|nr:MTH1187 family thiamine-binding protein [Deferrivibrio essentukiensis]MCB4204646.1 MTH1187 family thiamine-binding protein [Deferrivibrio essentukiensis]UOD34519.1 MTH1187 family thiamine-binding protein [Deferribacteraceae bacterium V6Fe1]
MKAMAYVSITPLDKGESVSQYVSKAVKVIKESGLEWQLTPMGTIVAGETTKEVLNVINDAVEALEDCNRISISIKIDYRKNREGKLTDKVDSVMKKL